MSIQDKVKNIIAEKLSVDLALMNILSDELIFPGIPYIDFVFNF